MIDADLRREVQELIAAGDLEGALGRLRERGPREGPAHREILQLSGRRAELARRRVNGLVTEEAAQISQNQIAHALLAVLGAAEDTGAAPAANHRGSRGRSDYWGSTTKAEATLSLPYDYLRAFRTCRGYVREVGGIITLAEEEIGRIRAHRVGNPLVVGLLGQKILLWLRETGPASTEVEIVVDNGQKSVVTDWGSNQRLLDRLLKLLE